jgi:hypothetical protein
MHVFRLEFSKTDPPADRHGETRVGKRFHSLRIIAPFSGSCKPNLRLQIKTLTKGLGEGKV